METIRRVVKVLPGRAGMEGPHSLGKSIEWKRFVALASPAQALSCPHSLGKLIEWKLYRFSFQQAIACKAWSVASPCMLEENN